jgi:tetratricopeptide (TPR) repeat protein
MTPVPNKGVYFGEVAVRAYILAKLGRTAEAVDLLLQVYPVAPQVPYLAWAVRWLATDPEAGPAVNRQHLIRYFGSVGQRYPGSVVGTRDGKADLKRALDLYDRIVTEPGPPMMCTYFRAVLLRKAGRVDEAVTFAEAEYEKNPNYHLAIAAGMARDAREEFDDWMRWQHAALTHQPDDVPVRLDLGDKLLDRRRFAEAVRWYQEAVDHNPDEGWGLPSLYYSRWKNGEGDEWLAKLRAYAAAHPDNDRADHLAWCDAAYIGHLPAPSDALANLTFSFLEKHQKGETVSGLLTSYSTSVESPSARLALHVQLLAMGNENGAIDLDFGAGEVQTPDPRYPRLPVRYQVWEYLDGEPKETGIDVRSVPAVGKPPKDVLDAVGWLANRQFRRGQWYDRAGEVMRELSGATAEHLVGAMAHPPAPPRGFAAVYWVYHCQVAAAMLAAHLDPDTPWAESERREVLTDLAYGPLDWTVDAAVIALGEVVNRDPDAADDVAEVFDLLLREQPTPGHVCYLPALEATIRGWPAAPAGLKAAVR